MKEDYLLKVKVQNNRIASLMNSKGIESVAELSRITKISMRVLGDLINMKASPLGHNFSDERFTDKPWREPVIRLADYFGVTPDEMFNEQQMYDPLPINRAQRAITQDQLFAIAPQLKELPAPEDMLNNEQTLKLLEGALGTLTPREQKVIQMRHGLNGEDEHNYQQLAPILKITPCRVMQIYEKGLRKLRHPSRSFELKDMALDTRVDPEDRQTIGHAPTSEQQEMLNSSTNVFRDAKLHKISMSSLTSWIKSTAKYHVPPKDKQAFRECLSATYRTTFNEPLPQELITF